MTIELPLQVAALVQPFHRDAAGQAAVADDRDDVVVVPLGVAGRRHPERRRDRRRGVGRPEDVVLRLRPAREAREAPLLADRLEPVPPSRQDLVRVALVADVPDEEVPGRVEDVVEGDRQLDRRRGPRRSARPSSRRSRSGRSGARPRASRAPRGSGSSGPGASGPGRGAGSDGWSSGPSMISGQRSRWPAYSASAARRPGGPFQLPRPRRGSPRGPSPARRPRPSTPKTET